MNKTNELKNTVASLELKIQNIENHSWKVFFHSPDDKVMELESLRRRLEAARGELQLLTIN